MLQELPHKLILLAVRLLAQLTHITRHGIFHSKLSKLHDNHLLTKNLSPVLQFKAK